MNGNMQGANSCEKFDSTNNEASDTTSFGPGDAVADSSAHEGTNDDDLAMSNC